jgi:repressor LexA
LFQIGDKYNMRSKSEELMLRIREYIESYFGRYSSTPTVREIAGAMKIAVSSAHRYLVAMAEKDMVFYENGTLSAPPAAP